MAGERPNLSQLYPNMEFATVEQLSMKVDRLMKRYDSEFAKTVQQFDAVIENPHAEHMLKVRTIEAKVRLLNSMSSDAARIALAVERQRRVAMEKSKENTKSKALALRMIEQSRKAVRVGEIDPSLAKRQPKVRMFLPGAKLTPTVGLDMPEPEM